MSKILLLLIFPFFLFGCDTIEEVTESNSTDIEFDPDAPILNQEEVDWLEIDVPYPEQFDNDTVFTYRLSLDYDNVEKLVPSIMQRLEGSDWQDVPLENYNEPIEFEELNQMEYESVDVTIYTFSSDENGVTAAVDLQLTHGEYRVIEVFTHYENDEPETVQVAIPFEIVEYSLPDLTESPDFVTMVPETSVISPDDTTFTFTVTNTHEEYNISGGESFIMEQQDGNRWRRQVSEDLRDTTDYTIAPGESQTFTHELTDNNELLETGRYRIYTPIYLEDGIPYPREETTFYISLEFDVIDE